MPSPKIKSDPKKEALAKLLAAEADYLRAAEWVPGVQGGKVVWTSGLGTFMTVSQEEAVMHQRKRDLP